MSYKSDMQRTKKYLKHLIETRRNIPVLLMQFQIYRSYLCFFENRCDRDSMVVKMDVAWWMESPPPQIIFPEKPSTCPILETIIEERETEEDDQEHDKEDV
ncbi:unnamed protein product [Brassica oleracea var. botrytis]|uniref:(rape) hypothetical protein n=2 Tax=Brassica TaxID=3705 RepID=A0A816HZK7_BRANA|nr:unnamed protein product [Brassica napus]